MNGRTTAERSKGRPARAGVTEPLSDAKRARIIALAQQELSVRQIAAEVGCSTGSVSNVCRLAGVQLDHRQTQAAAEARTVSARMQRVELADELIAVARGELARLNRPHTEYWGVGGQDPTVLSVVMPEPPPRGRRDLISGAMALVDRHIKLAALDAGSGNNSIVDRWLSAMLGEDEQ
jgi:Homeodomain-like domain